MVNGFKIEADILKMRYLDEIGEKIEEIEKEKEEKEKRKGNGDTLPSTKPAVKRKNINIRNINPSNSWRIETKDDLDNYIEKLKASLEKELGENTILNIEF